MCSLKLVRYTVRSFVKQSQVFVYFVLLRLLVESIFHGWYIGLGGLFILGQYQDSSESPSEFIIRGVKNAHYRPPTTIGLKLYKRPILWSKSLIEPFCVHCNDVELGIERLSVDLSAFSLLSHAPSTRSYKLQVTSEELVVQFSLCHIEFRWIPEVLRTKYSKTYMVLLNIWSHSTTQNWKTNQSVNIKSAWAKAGSVAAPYCASLEVDIWCRKERI